MEQGHVLEQMKSFNQLLVRYFIYNLKLDAFPSPTPTQIKIIEYLTFHQKEEVFQRDLEKVLNLRRATVSGVLQTMEKNLLIERKTSIEDARTKKIVLKDTAKEIFKESQIKLKELEKIVCQNVKEEELNNFCKVLDTMQNNLKESMKKVASKKKGVDNLC